MLMYILRAQSFRKAILKVHQSSTTRHHSKLAPHIASVRFSPYILCCAQSMWMRARGHQRFNNLTCAEKVYNDDGLQYIYIYV